MDQLAAKELASSLKPQIELETKIAKNIIFLFSYMLFVPSFIIFVIIFSLSLRYDSSGFTTKQEHRPQYQALPETSFLSTIELESQDARALALEDIFNKYNSPLKGKGILFVSQADQHSIDYRLLPAIAFQESTLCKKIIKNSYNCWGWGIYGSKVTKFKSFDEAIITITERIAKKYVHKGFDTPQEIVERYTPSDDGRWSSVVSLMMDKIHKEL